MIELQGCAGYRGSPYPYPQGDYSLVTHLLLWLLNNINSNLSLSLTHTW